MPNLGKPIPDRHYFELPSGINNMTDAEITTWAAELYGRIVSAMPGTVKKDEKGERE